MLEAAKAGELQRMHPNRIDRVELPFKRRKIYMRETIRAKDYAELIAKALPKGILLNTQGEKFNTMVIGWGGLCTMWGRECFTVYIREKRYSKAVLDRTGEFSLSIPLDGPNGEINAICGSKSGRNTDKQKDARLTLVSPRSLNTPGVLEYPLTLECKILYSQKQDIRSIPEDIRDIIYPNWTGKDGPEEIVSVHTQYIAEIHDAYILRKE